ncbi:hypothetical protein AMS68_004023 [Peltaster fructicola]|uniref:Phytanoyl-CoA dioxygenase n=1 Tax=Peltaster fructicola TaxID=286661 RepID=A0A6H0XUZ7_9PEZI|nr:hypothetical protein AMS68_004023 [Peltaster fructicola]
MDASAYAHLREQLHRDGFFIVPSFLSPDELSTLRAVATKSTARARDGSWPHIRTLPKQFPPWPADPSNGIWGVQHLLHPEMNDRDVYAASYFHPGIVSTVSGLLECPQEELVMELYNMLVRPDTNFALRWHRDDVKPEATADEERRRLEEPILHAQWNLALFDDASLVVVPGSHRRARTDMERSADPYEDDMPGQKIVQLKAGDLMFYNNNILHRGVYDSRVERMTLHGSMGMRAADPDRARNILQHGIGTWAARCDFSKLSAPMSSTATRMQSALLEMGGGAELGFCQTD